MAIAATITNPPLRRERCSNYIEDLLNTDDGRARASTTVKHGVTLAQQRGAKAFQRLEGGPTEAILEILRGAGEGPSLRHNDFEGSLMRALFRLVILLIIRYAAVRTTS